MDNPDGDIGSPRGPIPDDRSAIDNFPAKRLAAHVGVLALEIGERNIRHPERIIIIGAHYDSGAGSPGANDNGSGVAVLLELSRRFRAITPEKAELGGNGSGRQCLTGE